MIFLFLKKGCVQGGNKNTTRIKLSTLEQWVSWKALYVSCLREQLVDELAPYPWSYSLNLSLPCSWRVWECNSAHDSSQEPPFRYSEWDREPGR